MMLLVIVGDKLVDASGQIILQHGKHSQAMAGISTVSASGGDGSPRIQFGSYIVSSPAEWESVLRSLIGVHLRKVFTLLAKMQNVAASASRSTQLSSLRLTEQKVKLLASRLSAIHVGA